MKHQGARLSPDFWNHPKVREAWEFPTAVGLHCLALSYQSAHRLKGWVPTEFVKSRLPDSEERAATIAILLDAGIWHVAEGGWRIDGEFAPVPRRSRWVPVAIREAVLARDGRKCRLCGTDLEAGEAPDLDHVLPVSLGGKTTVENLQVAHPSCNRRKGARV